MSRAEVSNVCVHVLPYGNRACVSWIMGGARWHVNVAADTLAVQDDTIYKKPIEPNRSAPGYFPTRRLCASAAVHAPAIDAVLDVVRSRDLIAVGRFDLAAAEDAREAERRAAVAAKRVRDNAPALLAVVERVARLIPDAGEIGAGALRQLHAEAVAALALAGVTV